MKDHQKQKLVEEISLTLKYVKQKILDSGHETCSFLWTRTSYS